MAEVTLEVDQFEVDSQTLEKQLVERFPLDFLNLIKKIANEVATVGLTEKEACMICDMDFARFTGLKQREPLIRQLFERKNLEYKRVLLKPLSEKARTDDKLAQWLLMSRFPEDFNAKRRGGGDGNDDEAMMGAAIEWIQRGESSGQNQSGLINAASGRAFIIKKGALNPGDGSPPPTAHDILREQGPLIKRLQEHNLIPPDLK